VKLSPADARLVPTLRRLGVKMPIRCLMAARKTKLPLAAAVTLLIKETNGGANVFARYDSGAVAKRFAGKTVTKQLYLDYKRLRGPRGAGGMTGVGPCQLTYWTIQDRADAAGGCWKPLVNMEVGFAHLAGLIRVQGLAGGFARYNGASAYGRHAAELHTRFDQALKRVPAGNDKPEPNEPPRKPTSADRVKQKLPKKRAQPVGQLSPHFNLSEFHCHDGTRVPAAAVPALKRLCVDYLEPMRARFGEAHVLSGYRHRAYNKRIGGATLSQHIYDLGPASVAADVWFKRGTPAEWAAFARKIADGRRVGGVGRYDRSGFVHVDNGPRRDWAG
jgi:hypothetical protein